MSTTDQKHGFTEIELESLFQAYLKGYRGDQADYQRAMRTIWDAAPALIFTARVARETESECERLRERVRELEKQVAFRESFKLKTETCAVCLNNPVFILDQPDAIKCPACGVRRLAAAIKGTID